MENLLNNLKSDILQLIELQGEISKYEEKLLYLIDVRDKRNFNLEKAEKIKIKISELKKIFDSLKTKWF
jgi:hypothetical protein